MRRPHKLLVLAVLCAAMLAAPPVDAATAAPTPAQIRAAITTATASKQLWATINLCNYNGDAAIGIRGQMPALSFPSRLLMVVTLAQWSPTAHRYVALKDSYKLGGKLIDAGHTIQDGVTLRFNTSATLIGRIDFEWFRDGKRLGATTRMTTGSHGAADAGTPKHFSAAACTV